jgi:uncharacterized BrkB/YihY/UPF0761 family membrane protein
MFVFIIAILLFIILFVDFFFKWQDSENSLQRMIAWFCAISVVLLGIMAIYSFVLKKPLPLFNSVVNFFNSFR